LGVTEEIAEFIYSTSFDHLPSKAIAEAKKGFLDFIGVALAGSRDKSVKTLAEFVAEMGAKPISRIIGWGFGTFPDLAALVNGTMGHALDFDDVEGQLMYGHPSVPIIPAILALGEQLGISGREVIAAYVTGFEVETRIGASINPSHYRHGWHATATLGVMGSAAASSKILQLSPSAIKMALGIAASQACGLRQNFGSMTKPYHAGHASRCGVLAALLAQRGFTSDPGILEGPLGLCNVFGTKGNVNLNKIVEDLGGRFHIISSGISFKTFACCAGAHTALTALFLLMEDHDFLPEDIASVQVRVAPPIMDVLIHSDPKTGLEGKFSMPFCVAIGILGKGAGLEQFTDEKVRQPRTRDLMKRVSMIADSDMEKAGSLGRSALVTIFLKNGAKLEQRVDIAKGRAEGDPLSWEELADKYRDCARTRLPETDIEGSLRILERLEESKSIVHLVDCIVSKN
jgi:2-methylcitrate dehydratase PrpD